MLYEVKSRINAQIATRDLEAPATAIISITDVGAERNKFHKRDWIIDILEIQFDDVTAGYKNCITPKQAKTIARFTLNNYQRVERFLIHCEFGQSRSAGVAAAISKYYEGHSSGIFGNKAYVPNLTCYRLVLQALKGK